MLQFWRTDGRVIWQLKSPNPREFAIQSEKNANALRSAGRRGALTDV